VTSGRFSQLYEAFYGWLCGRPPDLRPWHYQWLAVVGLYEDLRDLLPTLDGHIVDVGCGEKPYASWINGHESYTGLDTYRGPAVDVVIQPNRPWPIESERFDAAICTQVLEHVTDLDHVLAEIHRVLKPGATQIARVPFASPEHGAPHDYRRFSRYELSDLFSSHYEILEVRAEGRIGSTLGLYLLIWIDTQIKANRMAKALRMMVLPLWIGFTAVVNVVMRLCDLMDSTGVAYSNVLIVARKRANVPSSRLRNDSKNAASVLRY
jgi:SAM-dependent methyltransferase